MMSTTPQLSIHDIPSQNYPSPAPMLPAVVGSGEMQITEGDDRSSSLSDIEDRTANTNLARNSHTIRGGSEANDTEAETERLEDSPQKVQKHTNVVLSSANDVYQESAKAAENDTHSSNGSPDRPEILRAPEDRNLAQVTRIIDARVDQTSDISSLQDSSEENERSVLPSNMSRKRKRKSLPSNNLSEDENTALGSMGKSRSPLSQAPLHSKSANKELKNETFLADKTPNSGTEKAAYIEIVAEATSSQYLSPSKSKNKNGKRKAKKTKDENPEHPSVAIAYADSQAEHFDSIEQVNSNGEDGEMEDIGESAEADVAARTEEGREEILAYNTLPPYIFYVERRLTNPFTVMKKKYAMDSLSAIEKCFATLRDKLFDERLAQYNDELSMLNQPIPTHPEYVAQKEVIDRYRDDKIDYEETLFKYKLIALQRKSIAEKAQIHSQYMQTVREIRDRNLEQLNEEWYQIQRERRSCEDNVPDYIYKFPTRRSQQIRQQTAYNTEVSILSGVAKYVGFPAAPDILGARTSEVDDDFAAIAAAMGQTNNLQAAHPVQRQPSSLRANSSSATAGFSQQKPAAEERFLEKNPWANPQHPAHHQQHHPMQRQVSNLSGPASPFAIPVGQRRIIDSSVAQGFASTITEPQSGPSPLVAPTTGTSEQMAQSGQLNPTFLAENVFSVTPSRLVETPIKDLVAGSKGLEVSNDKITAAWSGIAERSDGTYSLNDPSQNIAKVSNDASKQLPAKEGPALGSPSSITLSPRTQFPVIKAEDASQPPLHSPPLNRFASPDINRISTNGHPERFGVL